MNRFSALELSRCVGRRAEKEGGEETHRTNIDLDIAGRVPRKTTDEERHSVNKS